MSTGFASFRRALRIGAFSTLTASSAALGLTYWNDEGTRRAFQLYRDIGPVLIHYRYVEKWHKYFPPETEEAAEEDWDRLHEMYQDRVLASLQSLRGFYIKIGQVMANRSDLLPKGYIERLRTLEDAVPPIMSPEQTKEILQEAYGEQDLSTIFSTIDYTPLGSASIGQVYKATLATPEQPKVAVKVQTPGVEALFRSDIKSARRFCQIFAPEQVIVFDEIEKQFLTEFDYVREAEHLATVAHNMEPFESLVKVPRPFTSFCREKVLVMEYLEGQKLVDGVRSFGETYAASQGTTLAALEADMKAQYERDGLPPPYDGPGPTAMEWYRRYLRLRDGLQNLPRYLWYYLCRPVVYGITLGWASLSEPTWVTSCVPLNTAQLMDTLVRVHGHQILVNGYYNADPHPGNFLLMPDGRIGMLDYGQVKRLTEAERYHLCRVLLALHQNDTARLVRLARIGGYVSRSFNPDVIQAMTRIALDRDGRDVTEGMNLQQFMDKQFAIDPWEKTDDSIVLVVRVSLLIRGMGLMLNHPVSMATGWAPIAAEVMATEGAPIEPPHETIAG